MNTQDSGFVRTTAPLNRTTRTSLALNITLAVGATTVMNGLIFALGWNTTTDSAPRPSFSPPDWVVGVVWAAVLFPLMAAARWRLNAAPHPGGSAARRWVTGLLGFCLVWPLYTLALGSLVGGLLGNLAVILVAGVTIVRVRSVSPSTAWLIAPVIAWVAFATLIVMAQLTAR